MSVPLYMILISQSNCVHFFCSFFTRVNRSILCNPSRKRAKRCFPLIITERSSPITVRQNVREINDPRRRTESLSPSFSDQTRGIINNAPIDMTILDRRWRGKTADGKGVKNTDADWKRRGEIKTKKRINCWRGSFVRRKSDILFIREQLVIMHTLFFGILPQSNKWTKHVVWFS